MDAGRTIAIDLGKLARRALVSGSGQWRLLNDQDAIGRNVPQNLALARGPQDFDAIGAPGIPDSKMQPEIVLG